jgi:hypothetical protein
VSRITQIVVLAVSACTWAYAAEPPAKPDAHWSLTRADDRIPSRNVQFSSDGAVFNGRDSSIEIADGPQLGARDFTLSAWILADSGGDILSQYDSTKRRGFHLSIKNNAVTTSQANRRHLQFGIDNNRQSEWIDRGRPGKAILAFSLAVHDDHLYAGTCEPGPNESGRVFRTRGDGRWESCGAPDRSNTVTALAVFEGKLYAATGKYRLAGSALKESENTHLGGGVFRFEGDGNWTDCGKLPNVEAVGGLAVFRGRLYASSLYKPAGFFRYEGQSKWTSLPTPNGKRVEALAVYRDSLYATGYDEGHVYRFDGSEWTDLGQLGENTQTYSFAIYQGRLHVGTWPSGRVYRFEDANRWTDLGRLGNELEVMGMVVHNGRLLAGTLPLAEVYQYDGESKWIRLMQLDTTPNVRYRRAWTVAEFRGEVFYSTLPSGRIYSFAAGRSVAWDREIPSGWQHVAAIRAGNRLRLYVNGKLIAESKEFEPNDFDLTSRQPLRLGAGSNDAFLGTLRDFRVFLRALSDAEVVELAKTR